jgi:hypothetical protein
MKVKIMIDEEKKRQMEKCNDEIFCKNDKFILSKKAWQTLKERKTKLKWMNVVVSFFSRNWNKMLI